ncbi:Kinesin-like protein [Quillaja saponaria]|uniref:Kinesin-like protein n=1 Tax=Quillaja saponaria TaxID=32244 RepID=A0AAD7Q8X7_QUISA|nr:Kinesin-like protein [Quillaja saponaria]
MMPLTPDLSKKVGVGVTPSPSPFLTPRPERRRTDSRGEWNSNRQDKDKETNVQVLLRCRPLSDDEQRSNVPRVISCNEQRREVTVMQNLANKQVDRVFTFDKVFGPKAQQRSIYDQAISPIVNEVLEGFNCTVFAYGQTGTGKTYTMEGGMRNKGGDLPAEAGVIPRAVRQIFDMLEAQNADYSIKVTFLELYNEEITDLLAPEDNSRPTEDKPKKHINLMEDGKGCVVVRGLEEESVYSVNEIYALLERGAAKRRTADTLLNKRSSRSHSIFSITIHVKEAAIGDEELIKCGKLNLVDLAGSENISRSGAREGRAREAGEINKSLLTLGRVINALVEHSAHVPYRDSKLTRLLRDSLGGKTKTCIIATISPTAYCLEETLSTLDYASRAKNIKNRPEANQKVSKAVLLKDLYLEIERMKEDVRAAREKNGVYIPQERFAKDEAEKKARNEKIEQLENDLNLSEKQVHTFSELYLTEQEQKLNLESELKDCKVNLEKSTKDLLDLQQNYRVLVSKLKENEDHHFQATAFCELKDPCNAIPIFCPADQKDRIEAENQRGISNFNSQLDESLKDLHNTILGSVFQQQEQLKCMEEYASSYLASKCDATQALESRIKKMSDIYTSGIVVLKGLADTLQIKASSDMDQINSKVLLQASDVENFLATAVLEAKEVICNIHNSLDEQKQLLDFLTKRQEEGLQQHLASAQVITEATGCFFNDFHHRSSEVMKILEESQIERSNNLINFEKSFKEKAVKEEEQALEKIAAILAALTSKRTAVVSEASRNIQESSMRETKKLQQEMCNIKFVSNDAQKEVSDYVDKVKSHFMEDTFAASFTRAIMESCLQECSKRVDYSRQQWDNALSSISNLNGKNVAEIGSTVKENILKNHIVNQEFISASSCVDSDYYAGTNDMLAAVNGSSMLDHENKKQIDSITVLCMEQLKAIQEKHGEDVSNIQSQSENCLIKNYLIDRHTGLTPKRSAIAVPSIASIEEMRTFAHENVKEDNSLGNGLRSQTESKIPSLAVSPIRTPFADMNSL